MCFYQQGHVHASRAHTFSSKHWNRQSQSRPTPRRVILALPGERAHDEHEADAAFTPEEVSERALIVTMQAGGPGGAERAGCCGASCGQSSGHISSADGAIVE
jgi:hypothetical protein